ncbi:kinase [Pontibacillus halophilus JSM 076056 = DSM 19796]|uniref:Kinase n=1 Tax=Pontibacillus halophilus JSM 076056 = DSM 19796 TaxID=1385510 RepID=A0A0A5GRZ0_9BACI|nr:5-oxoprolinase subunit PxpB [Pontibacillus halophilus]KGX93930.1 kinase [Pontibacillus halophilus JSM 076056 = DSM 19796]
MRIDPFGDVAVKIELGTAITRDTHEKVMALHSALHHQKDLPIIEIVPSYTVLTVYYNPLELTFLELKEKLLQIYEETSFMNDSRNKTIVHLPVCYGGEAGPDLEELATYVGVDVSEVIQLHADQDYLVYMIGFLPGFPYLGGLDKRLSKPRRSTPRNDVPAGSVGIAGAQTGVYSVASPGGWNIIGRTPIPLVDRRRGEPFLLKAGEYVRFYEVDLAEFKVIQDQVERDVYEVRKGVERFETY